ncbi:hypothetical protein BU25DRAFT_8554 [Macroventuria anomochaeta]|uniref:Uncharacterized protein n=1 Tax=Macroventuria anomochaeta TaxID=301207 RepID=A0ACB6SHW8_9PLEO|nr:uncharacterized protein BU25DRAFT_8554 [Macroventuria anomochaeta]KAF2633557.1 hypothetical protein BU25DRAFT_8554 [Macroventuria anomochaeta]
MVFIGRSASTGSFTLHLVMLFCTCTVYASYATLSDLLQGSSGTYSASLTHTGTRISFEAHSW